MGVPALYQVISTRYYTGKYNPELQGIVFHSILFNPFIPNGCIGNEEWVTLEVLRKPCNENEPMKWEKTAVSN